MPSNYTPNYALNQWEADDRVQRTDFNADNAKIDEALKALADQKVGQSDLSALAARVSYLERDRIYISSYTGDGSDSRTISLPWAPKLMILISEGNDQIQFDFMVPGYTVHMISGSVSDTSGAPFLSGSTLTIRRNYWGNCSGKTSRYILIR